MFRFVALVGTLLAASVFAFATGSSFMPPQGTEIAKEVDALYSFLIWSSLVSFVLLMGGTFYFALKYKRKTPNDVTPHITHNNLLEFLWSFIPFLVFLFVFAWGWIIHHDMRTMPKDAFEVHVTGSKWKWDFQYKSGKKTTSEFYVPVGVPVKLIMNSRDVLHSFFVPSFRIKQDVVPGRYTALWFKADKLGSFQVFCTEYCGTSHSQMLAKLNVVPQAEFEEWLKDDPYKGLSLSQIGQKYVTQNCKACHNINSSDKKIGPGLLGLWGQSREFEKGGSLNVDGDYIRESVLYPQKKIVKGYGAGAQMNSFQGMITEDELLAVIEYLKTNK